jgi:uncharacterized protein YukE
MGGLDLENLRINVEQVAGLGVEEYVSWLQSIAKTLEQLKDLLSDLESEALHNYGLIRYEHDKENASKLCRNASYACVSTNCLILETRAYIRSIENPIVCSKEEMMQRFKDQMPSFAQSCKRVSEDYVTLSKVLNNKQADN